jgi:hypothetical protein
MGHRAFDLRPRSPDREDDAAATRARPRASDVSPAGLLALQASAGNRAVTATLSRWRDFTGARGVPQYDYKLVDGVHATAGKYHIKFHNVEQLDVFDEIHVVFEARDPLAYFFFTDAGVLIPAKSNKDAGLKAIAQELVDEQLATSKQVPDEEIQARRQKRTKHEETDKVQKEQWKQEAEAKAEQHEAKQVEAREASKASVDEDLHIDNYMRDVGEMPGERPAFVAYLNGTGPARPYWQKKADWYKLKRDSGWKVTLEEKRVAKQSKPAPKDVVAEHGLPATAKVFISTKPSGPKYVYYKPEITFPNYTTYAASKLAEKPPK